jgi:hypothetical protein
MPEPTLIQKGSKGRQSIFLNFSPPRFGVAIWNQERPILPPPHTRAGSNEFEVTSGVDLKGVFLTMFCLVRIDPERSNIAAFRVFDRHEGSGHHRASVGADDR